MKTNLKSLLFSLLFLSLLFSSCKQQPELNTDEQSLTESLFSAVRMDPAESFIMLDDFFPGNPPDSIDLSFAANSVYNSEENTLFFSYNSNIPPAGILKLWHNGSSRSIILLKSDKEVFSFLFEPGSAEYKEVALASSWNGWNPASEKLSQEDGIWKTSLALKPGKYYYQIVADGNWMLDPNNPDSASNNIGGYNSVFEAGEYMKQEDFRIYTSSYKPGKIRIISNKQDAELIVLWQNHYLDKQWYKKTNDGGFCLSIPEPALKAEKSMLRIYAYDNKSLSNELLIPLHQGKPVTDASLLGRDDMHAAIIYNVFVDRFYNGDTSNDKPTPHPDIHPRANFHGGDIKGIEQKVKEGFFTELGVNTIWMSPIVKNPEGAYGLYPDPMSRFSAYHGYWPVSFTQVDHRFGQPDELKSLVKASHDNEMNILLDFVANHVHENHPVYRAHPDWATNLYLPDGSLNTEKWDEHRLTTWFDVFLPTLELRKKEVYEMLSDSALFWIREYQFDGFRHDATKHIPEIFWRTLTRKLKENIVARENRSLYQIGETYGNGELISSYLSSGMLDAQFDFNLYDALVAALAKKEGSFIELLEVLKESFYYYGDHNLMGNISGNQDRGRFISYAGGDLLFDEDSKKAGWTRKIDVGEPVAYKKAALMMAFNMSIPGIPVIFYGDEIGMPGGNDPDNRKMMKFKELTPEELNLKEKTAQLAKFRRNNMAMIYGEFTPVMAEKDVFIFSRSYFNSLCIIAMNKGNNERKLNIEIPERFKENKIKAFDSDTDITIKNHTLEIKLQANSFVIYHN